ncbi:MAG: hypothetical protein ACJA1J_001774 [Sulfitobacter pontiacus]|jgi:hypothetical protein
MPSSIARLYRRDKELTHLYIIIPAVALRIVLRAIALNFKRRHSERRLLASPV